MSKLSALLILPACIGLLSALLPEQTTPPPPPRRPAITCFDAPRAALARFDAAASRLRNNQFEYARRILRDGAAELPGPYREQVEEAARRIGQLRTEHRRLALPGVDRDYLQARVDLAVYLGDFSAAVQWLWRLSKLDETKFAADRFVMRLLRDCLIWSDCDVSELWRLARLAKVGDRNRSSDSYGEWGIEHDRVQIERRRAARGPVAVLEACYETTRDFGGDELYRYPRYALHLLQCLLPMGHLSDDQLRALNVKPARFAQRIATALRGLGDVEGANAWQDWGGLADVRSDATQLTTEQRLQRAEEAYRRGALTTALGEFRFVAALGPEQRSWGVAQFNVGACLQSLGRFDEAIHAYRELIGGDVDDAEPVSIMQWHRNYRSSAASAIARCLEQQGKFREAAAWLELGHLKYRIGSECGTCEYLANRDYALRRAHTAVRAFANFAKHEFVWDILSKYQSNELGFSIIEEARRRGNSVGILAEIDRRIAMQPWQNPAVAEHRSASSPPAEIRRRQDILFRMRRVAQLAVWCATDDYDALFRALVDQSLGVYEVYWSSRRPNAEFDRWYARQAAAYFLDNSRRAGRWLAEHSPAEPHAASWHQLLSAALGTDAILRRMELAVANVVTRRMYPNSAAWQSTARQDSDLLRDTAFLPDHARDLLYARTKTRQEYRPISLTGLDRDPLRFPISLGH